MVPMKILIRVGKKIFLFVSSAVKDVSNHKYSKLVVLIISLLLIVLMAIFYFYTSDANICELSSDELNAIEEYVNNTKIEDAVGQILMVGIPGDIANYSKNKNISFVISELGIGNLFANNYNYYDKNYNDDNRVLYFNNIISFHNHLQAMNKNKIPLLIAANFESPDLSCFEYGIVLPPESLTLSSTQDIE